MKRYGIIGKPLEHSWSGVYFAEKFAKENIDAEYRLYECESQAELKPTISRLDGCNITIPYKEAVMPLLEEMDPVAKEIGAVNVVKVNRGVGESVNRLSGYNTDWIGFVESIKPLLNVNENVNANQALIFGTGGVAKAVAYGLSKLGVDYSFISRPDYKKLTKEIIEQHKILINCTPLGMWPKVEDCVPIPYEGITTAHLLYDCVYNPEETEFLRRGRIQGARTKNGLEMLHIQAEYAWRIWKQ